MKRDQFGYLYATMADFEKLKLKPCPFCASTPDLCLDRNTYTVVCGCGASNGVGWVEDVLRGTEKDHLKAARQAIRSWNKRRRRRKTNAVQGL